MKIKIFICVYFLYFITQGQVYSIKDCAETALKNNLDLRQAAINIENAKINQKLASNASLPSVNGNANYGYQFGRNIDFVSNTFVNQSTGAAGVSIDANVVLYNFGRINEAKNQQNKNLEAVSFEKEDIKNTVLLTVIQAYSQILFQKELLKIAQNQVLTTQKDVERTNKLVMAGTQTELNLINLKAKMANDEFAVVNAENQLRIAKLNLIQLMNLPSGDIDMSIFDIETPNITLDSSIISMSSNEIYKKAYENQPAIKNNFLRAEAAEFARKSNKSAKYPTLSLSAGINSRYSSSFLRPENNRLVKSPLPNQLIDNFGQNVYLNLNVPILGNYRLRANEQNAIIGKERAKLALENAANQLRKKIESAQTEYILAQKSLNAQENVLFQNQEALKATQKRYDAGLANSVDLVNAQNNTFKSNADVLRAKYDLFLKNKVLNFYIDNELIY